MKSEKKKFTSNVEEIMKAGTEAIMIMLAENPTRILIKDELTDLVAHLAVNWFKRKENEE